MTVDVCNAAITADTSYEQLYVAATRGRHGNHLWVVVDSDRDVVRDREDLLAPEQILSRVLERRDLDRLSAHQVLKDSLRDISSLARLGAIFEDAARTATDQWLRDTLTDHGLAAAADEPEWPSLFSRAREMALAGHDLANLVEEAIRMRPIGGAHSTAAVLHWRLGALGASSAPRRRGPLASLPPNDGPDIEVAHQAGELMRQRWRELRAALAATTHPLPWAQPLGARPNDPDGEAAWLTAATALTAYRERYQIPDHNLMLGPRQAASHPDARAAWDNACLQADGYFARRLRDLDARQQAILDNPPPSDPAELERAQHRLDAARGVHAGWNHHAGDQRAANTTREQLLVQRLEQAAQAHRDWRRAVNDALALRRQILLELRRRRSPVVRTAAQVRAP